MTNLLVALKNLGGTMGKGLLIECFLEWYGDELIAQIKDMLDQSGITAEDIPDFVLNNKALPIPDQAFSALKGLEDYLEQVDPARIFEWIQKARPDLAIALIALDDAGAEYIVRFKMFMIDSIKAVAPSSQPEQPTQQAEGAEDAKDEEGESETDTTEEPAVPEMTVKKITCEECGGTWNATEEEAAKATECPFCGQQ